MRTVHLMETTASTQQEARRLLTTGLARIGDVVVADQQTAGRGRFGRTWISPRGGLYATFVVPSAPAIAPKSGLAVVRALRSAGIDAGLKWPNDVLVDGRKIAGVLVESDGVYSLVGVGLNLLSAPVDGAAYVTAYTDAGNRDAWVLAIAQELHSILSGGFAMDEYRAVCLTLGLPVRGDALRGEPPIEGIAVDVDEEGNLLVQTASGRRSISCGECLHLHAFDAALDEIS